MGSSTLITIRLNEISHCLSKGMAPVTIIQEYSVTWNKSPSTIKRYIAEVRVMNPQKSNEPKFILSNEEVEENLSKIIRDTNVSNKDRINATNTLIKMRDLVLKMKKEQLEAKKVNQVR